MYVQLEMNLLFLATKFPCFWPRPWGEKEKKWSGSTEIIQLALLVTTCTITTHSIMIGAQCILVLVSFIAQNSFHFTMPTKLVGPTTDTFPFLGGILLKMFAYQV